jgi:hypothetical protein
MKVLRILSLSLVSLVAYNMSAVAEINSQHSQKGNQIQQQQIAEDTIQGTTTLSDNLSICLEAESILNAQNIQLKAIGLYLQTQQQPTNPPADYRDAYSCNLQAQNVIQQTRQQLQQFCQQKYGNQQQQKQGQ